MAGEQRQRWDFIVLVEVGGHSRTEAARELADRIVGRLKREPRLVDVRDLVGGAAYTTAQSRLVHVARVVGAFQAADEHEAEAFISQSIMPALPGDGRKRDFYFWPAQTSLA